MAKRILYWFAGALLAHLVFFAFTGLAFWSPLQTDDAGRFTLLMLLHTVIPAAAVAVWLEDYCA